MSPQERFAAFQEALAAGDWAKIAAWQESERQIILTEVERLREGLRDAE
jgi:hypothetical protein